MGRTKKNISKQEKQSDVKDTLSELTAANQLTPTQDINNIQTDNAAELLAGNESVENVEPKKRGRRAKCVIPYFLRSSHVKKKAFEQHMQQYNDENYLKTEENGSVEKTDAPNTSSEDDTEKKKKRRGRKPSLSKRSKNIDPDTKLSTKEQKEIVEDITEITKQIELVDSEHDGEDLPRELKNCYMVFRDEALKYPLLTAAQEKELSKRVLDGDEKAFTTFVQSNYRLVIACAKQIYTRRGRSSILEFMDIIQEGLMGLLIAVRKFDYRMNTRFSTYGVPWIYQRINRATDSQREGFSIPGYAGYCMRARNEEIKNFLSGEINEKNTPNQKLKRIRELAAVTKPIIAIDPAADPEENPGVISPELISSSTVKDDSSVLDQIEDEGYKAMFHNFLQKLLSPEEYEILCQRHGMGPYSEVGASSLRQIAESRGRSVEFTRLQIEGIERRLRNNDGLAKLNKEWFSKPFELPETGTPQGNEKEYYESLKDHREFRRVMKLIRLTDGDKKDDDETKDLMAD